METKGMEAGQNKGKKRVEEVKDELCKLDEEREREKEGEEMTLTAWGVIEEMVLNERDKILGREIGVCWDWFRREIVN